MKGWEWILFVCLKCSLDLEVSLVEKSKTECSKKLEAIKPLELRSTFYTSQRSPKWKERKETLDSFKTPLKQYKMRKYRRDVNNFKEGTSYQWQKSTTNGNRTKVKTGISHQYDNYSSSVSDKSSTQCGNEDPFDGPWSGFYWASPSHIHLEEDSKTNEGPRGPQNNSVTSSESEVSLTHPQNKSH